MEWLNYHHLYYFAVIAKEGGVSQAARKLRLTHSTLSMQLRALEEHLGEPLFERRRGRLVLTPFGADAAGYAEDIFRLGGELEDLARGRGGPRGDVLRIGVVAGMPKTLVHHLLTPVLDSASVGATIFRQDASAALVELLAAGRLHLVLTNDPPALPPGSRVHAHLLGETDVLLYASGPLSRRFRAGFPGSLSGAPFVLPPSGSSFRHKLDEWFSQVGVLPVVRAEVEDAGLLRVFGSVGRGVFPVRAALKAEVEDLHDVKLVGACAGVRERYFALTSDRRMVHAAVAAVVERGRADLHAPASARGRRRARLP